GFSEVLLRQPENLEAVLGLGDVKAAQGDYDRAEANYRRAATIDPTSAEVAERLSRERPRTFSWRLDTNGSYSRFSRESRPSWRESFNQISYQVSPNTVVHGRWEISERFDRLDNYFQAGVDHRLSDRVSGYIYLGFTPSANFRERRAASGGGAVRLGSGQDRFGPTVFTIDTRQATYGTGDVTTIIPGLQQYLLAGRLWLSAKWINTLDEIDRHRKGWSARVDGQVVWRVILYAGLADAPETQANLTLDTRSYFGGIVVQLTPRLSARLDYLHEDRQDSFIRESVNMGISFNF
ncbi:MAG: YaiO family outer membrane beta-barrel protein, partial [Gammaproteobacteria bacterium]|nr:YaiO family outer membrane beta-barrel protein [Gammaproteobacteria bacterium]